MTRDTSPIGIFGLKPEWRPRRRAVTVAAFHQFVPTLDAGAVGAHTLEIQRCLREAGWDSEVFSEHTRDPYEGRARLFTEYGASVPAHGDDVVLYHAAIGSTVADWLLERRPARLVVDYHNITPPEWFMAWEPALAYGLGWGRAQLRTLARRTRFGIADSAFNAAELAAAGVRHTAVLPILVPPESLHGDGLTRSVGRAPALPSRDPLALRRPPGAQQAPAPPDRIAALSVFRNTGVYDPAARLALVGASVVAGRYEEALQPLQPATLGVRGAPVTFTGAVSDGVRNAYYTAADVFVCLSGPRLRGVPRASARGVAPPAPDRRVRVHRGNRDARHRRRAPSSRTTRSRRRRPARGRRRVVGDALVVCADPALRSTPSSGPGPGSSSSPAPWPPAPPTGRPPAGPCGTTGGPGLLKVRP